VVADIGTGTGHLLSLLGARFARVIAVDPSGRMLEAARERPEVREQANISFRGGSLASLPLTDGEVDVAIASLVLHHVTEPASALAELRRVLRPGGRLLIIEQEAHHHAGFHERMGDTWWGFEPGRLEGWLEETGFDDVRYSRLRTARPLRRELNDVPPLYVMTARAAGIMNRNA
jgi:ArsR family transcriptional regulator